MSGQGGLVLTMIPASFGPPLFASKTAYSPCQLSSAPSFASTIGLRSSTGGARAERSSPGCGSPRSSSRRRRGERQHHELSFHYKSGPRAAVGGMIARVRTALSAFRGRAVCSPRLANPARAPAARGRRRYGRCGGTSGRRGGPAGDDRGAGDAGAAGSERRRGHDRRVRAQRRRGDGWRAAGGGAAGTTGAGGAAGARETAGGAAAPRRARRARGGTATGGRGGSSGGTSGQAGTGGTGGLGVHDAASRPGRPTRSTRPASPSR